MKKKFLKNKFILKFLSFIAYIYVWLVYLTSKNKFFIDSDLKNNYIICIWHNNFLMMPFLYNAIIKTKLKNNLKIKSGAKAYLLTSNHNNGNLVEAYFSLFNFISIRGSTNRNGNNKDGARAFFKMLDVLKNGFEIGITPDGPIGPPKSITDGVIILSKKSQKPIKIAFIKFKKYYELKTWDSFQIPKIFNSIEYHLSYSIYFDKKDDILESKMKLESKMNELENTNNRQNNNCG